ncbi:unnamed protein product, partial [Penicillium discolor]
MGGVDVLPPRPGLSGPQRAQHEHEPAGVHEREALEHRVDRQGDQRDGRPRVDDRAAHARDQPGPDQRDAAEQEEEHKARGAELQQHVEERVQRALVAVIELEVDERERVLAPRPVAEPSPPRDRLDRDEVQDHVPELRAHGEVRPGVEEGDDLVAQRERHGEGERDEDPQGPLHDVATRRRGVPDDGEGDGDDPDRAGEHQHGGRRGQEREAAGEGDRADGEGRVDRLRAPFDHERDEGEHGDEAEHVATAEQALDGSAGREVALDVEEREGEVEEDPGQDLDPERDAEEHAERVAQRPDGLQRVADVPDGDGEEGVAEERQPAQDRVGAV